MLGEPKPPEWKRRISGTNPGEGLPREMECQVEMGWGREEMKTPQPSRRPPQIVGGPKRVAPLITELRRQWRSRATRIMGQWRRGAAEEKGSMQALY